MNLDQHGNEFGKLFVGGLHQSTTNESLEKYFSNFGEIEEALVMMDNRTNRSRGFGYVKFKNTNSVDDVLAQKQHIIDLKEVDPKRCNINMKGKNRRLFKIFVGGIAINHDEEVIRNYFSQFGQVTEVNLLTSPEKDRHRGFAFVGFKDDSVVKHLISLHYLVIKGKQVEIKAMEPPNPTKSMPSYPNQNKILNSSINMKNNGIFGRMPVKNPMYRPGWLEWNSMFPRSSAPSDWPASSISFANNPNTSLVNSTLANSPNYPSHNQLSSNHSLQAMIWTGVGQNSHVDQLGHQNTVTQSQHNIFPTTHSSQIVPQTGYNHGLAHNAEMNSSGRNWSMNRMSNQTHNSYYLEQHQQSTILHDMNRPNGPASNWPATNNSWANGSTQNYQNRLGNNHANLMQNHGGNSGNTFENWSSMNNQLNNISSSSHENQFNIQSHSNSGHLHQNPMNKCWSNSSQYASQKMMFSDENIAGSYGGKPVQHYSQTGQSRLPGMNGNLRKGMKNYPSFPRTGNDQGKIYSVNNNSDQTQFSSNTSTLLSGNNASNKQSTLTNAANTSASTVNIGDPIEPSNGSGDNFLVNRETTGSPNSTSNSSASGKNVSISSANTTITTANSTSVNCTNSSTNVNNESNGTTIIPSNSNNQIPIPSH